MKKLRKRNLVAAAVLLFVCMAMYLNWRYAENVAQTEKVLGESTLVSAETDAAGGEAPAADAESGGYFASARLSRQQARDNALALLQEAAAMEEADQETVDGAADSIQVIAAYTLAEAQIENLVTAKGYADCVAFMGEDSISVVVDGGGEALASEDIARITDIVKAETDYTAGQIKIVEAD